MTHRRVTNPMTDIAVRVFSRLTQYGRILKLAHLQRDHFVSAYFSFLVFKLHAGITFNYTFNMTNDVLQNILKEYPDNAKVICIKDRLYLEQDQALTLVFQTDEFNGPQRRSPQLPNITAEKQR